MSVGLISHLQKTSRLALSQWREEVDQPLLVLTLVILGFGLVMVASSSISVAVRETGNPFYFFERQSLYAILSIFGAFVAYQCPLEVCERLGMIFLFAALGALVMVLIPHVGHAVNGSRRWIGVEFINIQVTEVAKLLITIYLAGYIVRRYDEVRTRFSGFLKPMIVIIAAGALMLKEPDYGSAVVLLTICLSMLFIAGGSLRNFLLFLGASLLVVALLAVSSPYRLERLTSFLNPWAYAYSSGYQLTQSLIAIGSGSWFGVGLGDSIQKLFFLPEAHTDFLFSVLAEELGLAGVYIVVFLYAALVYRGFTLSKRALNAGAPFAAWLGYGISVWLGLQAFLNMAVDMGLLPTKGLTLPLMSYGGSSLVVDMAAIGLLQRIHKETVVQNRTGSTPGASS